MTIEHKDVKDIVGYITMMEMIKSHLVAASNLSSSVYLSNPDTHQLPNHNWTFYSLNEQIGSLESSISTAHRRLHEAVEKRVP